MYFKVLMSVTPQSHWITPLIRLDPNLKGRSAQPWSVLVMNERRNETLLVSFVGRPACFISLSWWSRRVFWEVVLTSSSCIFIVGQREEEEWGEKTKQSSSFGSSSLFPVSSLSLSLARSPSLRCPFSLPCLLITEAFWGLVSFLTLILPPPPPERQQKNRGKGWLE